MSKVIAKEITVNDIVKLCADMRITDKQELEALEDKPVLNQVLDSVLDSSFSKSMFVDDKLICLIGVTPINNSEIGKPWMLGTSLLDKYPIEIVRQSSQYIAEWLEQFEYLYNVIDARNTKSIKWLKHTGFTIHDAEPMGRFGLPFHPFTMFPRGK